MLRGPTNWGNASVICLSDINAYGAFHWMINAVTAELFSLLLQYMPLGVVRAQLAVMRAFAWEMALHMHPAVLVGDTMSKLSLHCYHRRVFLLG